MAQSVRKIDKNNVEVLFDTPLPADGGPAQALKEFAAENEDLHLIVDPDGGIEGLQSPSKTYVAFLQKMNVSKETIQAFRDSLDDSRKAVRRRQYEPRRPR